MRSSAGGATAALLLLAATAAAGDPDARALARAIDGIVQRQGLEGSLWAAEVRSLTSGRTLYERAAIANMTPASTLKLLTSAAALDVLGPEARATTSVESAARLDGAGRLLGDVFLVGRGDASLSRAFHEGDSAAPLDALADALLAAGVRHVEGRLIGHEGAFPGERRGSDWTWEDLVWRYGAEVSALSFADNCVLLTGHPGERPGDLLRVEAEPLSDYYTLDLTASTSPRSVDSELRLVRDAGGNVIELSGTHPLGAAAWEGCVALEDPALWATTVFAERLRSRGISVARGVSTSSEPLPEGVRVLAAHQGATLLELLPEITQKSQNLHTELLLRRLGLAAGEDGSLEASQAVLRDFLERLGVDPGTFTLRDASGLSRTNLVTARGMVDLLAAMARHPHAEAFRTALAIPGEEGTLEHRMLRDPALRERVRAKTGTLRHTYALAGYADSRSGARLAFAIFVNHHSGPPGAAVWAIDEIVRELVSR